MPWKEPGDKPRESRGREPWGSGGHGNGPDLEAWLSKARRRLGPFGHGPLGVVALVVIAIILWFLIGGWASIGAQQTGVVLRFGRLERILQPGVHLRFPSPIERVLKIDTGRAQTVGDEARLLTRDDQLVLVDYEVRYKITDVRAYLYATRDASELLRGAAIAAMRAVIGQHDLACLLADMGARCTAGKVDDDALAAALRTHLDSTLADAHDVLGITVTQVSVQGVGVPSEVKSAFDAIDKAHAANKAARASAEANVARSKAEAATQAAGIKTAAAAYQRKAIARAHAEAARFGEVLTQYQAAPQVTEHRLWLDAMQAVLTKNHVVVNTGSGSVIVQFPSQHTPAASTPASAASSGVPASGASAPAPAGSTGLPLTSGPALQGVGA